MVEFKSVKPGQAPTEPKKTENTTTYPEKPEHRFTLAFKGGELTGYTRFSFKDKKTGEIVNCPANMKATGLKTFDGKTRIPVDLVCAMIEGHKKNDHFKAVLAEMIANDTRQV